MTKTQKITAALLFGWLLGAIIHEANAGPFLDLDIGMNIPCDTVKQSSVTDYTYSCGEVAQDNPIGIVRAGWQFKGHDVWKVNVQPHAYYEHASSIVTNHERGLNVLMIGVRIQ